MCIASGPESGLAVAIELCMTCTVMTPIGAGYPLRRIRSLETEVLAVRSGRQLNFAIDPPDDSAYVLNRELRARLDTYVYADACKSGSDSRRSEPVHTCAPDCACTAGVYAPHASVSLRFSRSKAAVPKSLNPAADRNYTNFGCAGHFWAPTGVDFNTRCLFQSSIKCAEMRENRVRTLSDWDVPAH